MKRIIALMIMLIIALSLTSASAVVYPEKRGAVNDDAAVLSESTARDVELLNERSKVHFTVVTRHFLGGAEAQSYCSDLFAAWNLSDQDVLLLLVIGEEKYAAAMGGEVANKLISGEQLNSLFSSKLRQPFIQERDYDKAVGEFLLAAGAQAARAQGTSLNTAGLFGTSEVSGTSQQSSSSGNSWYNFGSWTGNLWNGFFSSEDLNDPDTTSYSFDYDHDSGFSPGKLILIVAVLFIILRNRRRRK